MAQYDSNFTGQHNDGYEDRIAALENTIAVLQSNIQTLTTALNNKANLNDVMVVKYGRATGPRSGNSSIGSATITYAQFRIDYGYTFSAVPAVSIVADDVAGGVFSAEIDGAVTTSYCYVTIYGPDVSNYACYWTAIGPR